MQNADEIAKFVRYDAETGLLFWIARARQYFPSDLSFYAWNSRYAGKEAGRLGNKGYRRVSLFDRVFMAHRIVWAINHDAWPQGPIDHIDHDRCNNRLGNLRVTTVAGNNKNKAIRKDNTSGATGVFICASTGKWRATVKSKGKTFHIGLFADFDVAVSSRAAAAQKLGFHANHGANTRTIDASTAKGRAQ